MTDIVEFQSPREGLSPVWKKSLASLSTLAACLCLVFFGYYQPNFSPYGTLRLQINPDVTLTLSRNDRVVGLEGGNQDGWDLIAGYDYHGKDRDTAADELVDRAMEMGYLSDGDTISVTVSSDDGDWQQAEEGRDLPAPGEQVRPDHCHLPGPPGGCPGGGRHRDHSPSPPPRGTPATAPRITVRAPPVPPGAAVNPPRRPPVSSGDSGYQTAGNSGYGPQRELRL